jgi:hypothetical protein
MHFHLPKPLHGWRAFVGEVAIIMFGVLLALAAEQIVEWMHWRDAVAAVQSAMNQELSNDRARWEAMIQSQPCDLQRLEELDRWSRDAPPQARLHEFRGPTIWYSRTSAWQMANAGATLTHIPLKQRLAYSGLYDHLELMQPFITQAIQDQQKMASETATADDPESRRDLRRSIVQARLSLGLLKGNYGILRGEFEKLGVKADVNSLPVRTDNSSVCQPLAKWQ